MVKKPSFNNGIEYVCDQYRPAITDTTELSKEEKRKLFAKYIRSKLRSVELDQKKFAAKLNKKPPEISKWLSGNHNFTLDTIFEIENQLKIKLVELGAIDLGREIGSRNLQLKTTKTSSHARRSESMGLLGKISGTEFIDGKVKRKRISNNVSSK